MLGLLSIKQIVDILYEYTVLDYIMVFIVIGLTIVGFIKNKVYKDFKTKLNITDFVIVVLAVVYFFSFLRNTDAWKQICKIESAFLVFFLGRVYGNKELNYKKICSFISYSVVYANTLYRIFEVIHYKITSTFLKSEPFGIYNGGAFYNYKTDLALGLIVASILIYYCSQIMWLKLITIGPVVAIIIFTSGARTCKLILIIEYIIMLAFHIKKNKKSISLSIKTKLKVLKTVFGMVIASALSFFVFIQCFEPLNHKLEELIKSESETSKLFNIFHGRNIIWWDAISYFKQQSILTRFIGIDLCSETQHNLEGDRFHNLYFKLIYSIGYIGTILFIYLIYRLFKSYILSENEEVKYLFLTFFVMFLGISLTMEGLEYTQMTWYGFIMAGIVVTQSKKQRVNGIEIINNEQNKKM